LVVRCTVSFADHLRLVSLPSTCFNSCDESVERIFVGNHDSLASIELIKTHLYVRTQLVPLVFSFLQEL